MISTIHVPIAHSPYDILVGQTIMPQFKRQLKRYFSGKQIAVVTNRAIYNLHGNALLQALNSDGQPQVLFVPDGENAKSFDQVQYLYTKLLENKLERNALIIAFGGGVIGDLAGFVAATFLRGVGFVQLPTTLLAQVDSSIGGKVGVNHPLGKNLIGAFKQPLLVFSDIDFLLTLPDAEIRCGLGEVIKYGLVLNKDLFFYLEENLEKVLQKDAAVLQHLVEVSSREKAAIVARDEQEKNLRMVLNFGHTFGHALEAEFQFGELKHGEAVILGMKCALRYAHGQNMLSTVDYQRAMALLKRIPITCDRSRLQIPQLIKRMHLDKKVRDGHIRLVLPDGIGHYRLESAADTSAMEKAFEVLFE